jgi:hypothetical protein
MNIISIESRYIWIPLENCKDRTAYYIHARNAKVGIFNSYDKGFIISRHKFKENFLFTEFHFDTGAPYGTVKPLRELGPVPEMTDAETLVWLNGWTESIIDDPWLTK